MLYIRNISKKYQTGDLVQTALDDVSLNLRDNEFVAILGPSGSGKTTLLNIIGGLDRYDSGDLVINGITTRKYQDRDWDSYRNHTIGFVFQSYNLIPHQSILANVELALTISGISRAERRQRAREALESVGLGDQLHKKPNQLSGGQMQRVAIARALVNNPDILLADEPTGALDSETSVQVMELLKEVAKDRLVVMVTHNGELAEEYATRIVHLRDGKIVGDSNAFTVEENTQGPPKHQNMGRSSMSFFTSLFLSFNNLLSKKTRTLLTSFAGSIGIIGIALILSLSTGVKQYVQDIQKSTMTSYPITIDAQTVDLTSMLLAGRENAADKRDHELDGVYSNNISVDMASSMVSSLTKNNLTDFKKYLEDPSSKIHQYLGENGVVYSYAVKFNVYAKDPNDVLINTQGISIGKNEMYPSMGFSGNMESMSNMMMENMNHFQQLLPGKDGALVSNSLTDTYDVYGSWPQSYDEVVLIMDKNNEIQLTALYELGFLPSADYFEMMEKLKAGEKVETDVVRWDYEDIYKQEFYLIPACDQYVKNSNGSYSYIANDVQALTEKLPSALKLKIVGIVRPSDSTKAATIRGTVGYTSALSDYLIQYAESSAVIQDQKNSPTVNILNGLTFSPSDDDTKAADAAAYLASLSISEKAAFFRNIVKSMYPENSDAVNQILAMEEYQLAAMLDQYLQNGLEKEMLISIYDQYISSGTYEENMTKFGLVSRDAPSSISLYADTFENKDNISTCIEEYNATVEEMDKITYTDYIGLLLSSVTTIVDVISYVLIAFVAVSLIVSSIMIGIITYISVLERTKEIGILRAIGASKSNIRQVFNAETFIIGLFSGLIGIAVSLLLIIPGNMVIHALVGSADVNAVLPVGGAIILMVLSTVLTLIGGFIPSRKAAKKDPVTALRTE